MKLFFDSAKVAEIEGLLAEAFKKTEQTRTKVHLSDTCYCPFKCYNRLTKMERMPFNKNGIGRMTVGSVGQTIIQGLFPSEWSEVEHPMIPSHADVMLYFDEMKAPIEVKFTTTRIFRAADIKRPWNMQLMGYISLHDAPYGWFLIMNTFSMQWTAFKMIMTTKEKQKHLDYIREFETIVYMAVEDEEPEMLIKFFVTVPTEERQKECRYCDYRPGRKRKSLGLEGEGCPFYIKSSRVKKK